MSNPYAGLMRAIVVLVGGIAIGVGLRLVVWRAPALSALAGPIYWLVAAAVVVGIWHVTKRRSTRDRRREARRHTS